MTIRYVGPGGSDAANGLSWANRKLTLNGVEDTPIAAGDTVYVGPGVYREMLTLDVSGTAGNAITYIGDTSGANTDGIGGEVLITGSDNDQTATRTSCVSSSGRSYRSFRGFSLAGISTGYYGFYIPTSGDHFIIEDCYINPMGYPIYFGGGIPTGSIVRRCVFQSAGTTNTVLRLYASSPMNDLGIVIENNIFLGGGFGVRIDAMGGITIRNNLFQSGGYHIYLGTVPSSGQVINVNNNVFYCANNNAMWAVTLGYIIEDYNNLYSNGTDRTNVATGTNSTAYVMQFAAPLLGTSQTWLPFMPSPLSALRALASGSPATLDLDSHARPATNAKNSWGPRQFMDVSRSVAQYRGASGASLKLADAGRVQFVVPVTAVSTTFSAYVYREADYAGTLPQMIVKQFGQADTTVTDTGSAETWNQLTTTLTPSATPVYAIIELVSNNTATSGSYAVYFDDIGVN